MPINIKLQNGSSLKSRSEDRILHFVPVNPQPSQQHDFFDPNRPDIQQKYDIESHIGIAHTIPPDNMTTLRPTEQYQKTSL